jgi:hypothetical protein
MRLKAERSSAAADVPNSACRLSAGAGVYVKADVTNSACRVFAKPDLPNSACGVSAKADVSRQGGFSEIFLPLPYENQIHLHR